METSPTGVGVRKFKETSEASTYKVSSVRVDVGLCESHCPTTNVHSSTLSTHEIKKGQGNFSHRGRCEKVQGMFRRRALTPSAALPCMLVSVNVTSPLEM